MVDYSRFDHIGSDSDDDVNDGTEKVFVPTPSASVTPATPLASASSEHMSSVGGGGGGAAIGGGGLIPRPAMVTASKKGKEGRIKFEHEGGKKKRSAGLRSYYCPLQHSSVCLQYKRRAVANVQRGVKCDKFGTVASNTTVSFHMRARVGAVRLGSIDWASYAFLNHSVAALFRKRQHAE